MSDRTLGADESSLADGYEATLATVRHDRGDDHDGSRGDDRPQRRGALIDRYMVLDMAGAGAMGMVLIAYDPELDRRVAIKLLKFDGETARVRLQREAQALAKLDHPNVVAIHDVGTHEGQLFMAMEFVEGQTLGRWMSALGHPRPWPEVVRVFSDAGRGLAAAHAAGLVHRDFKPENVMLGKDGRVRVMDFGLARSATQPEPDLASEDELMATDPSTSHQALAQHLTRTGALMGTPAYMSPEQFHGRPADSRSDQFGFCIALYEALYGQRPFPDKSLSDLIESLTNGRLEPLPNTTPVPAWLRKVVLRGLSSAPADRWPSMDALLDALADDPSIRRRKWWAAGLAVVLLGAATTGVVLGSRGDADTCHGFEHKLDGIWDQPRRDELRTAILATGLSYAPGTWTRIEPRVDAWADAWVDARLDACLATKRGEQSSELLDLRMACLDRQLTHLRTIVDTLAHADAAAVEHADAAVAKLPNVAACADGQALRAGAITSADPTDPREAETVAQLELLEQRMIEADTLAELGQVQRALELMHAVASEADDFNHPPTRVHALLALGRVERAAADYQAAETSLRAAYREAILARLPGEAGAAARLLVGLTGGSQGLLRPADGRQWAFHAEALTTAEGDDEQTAEYRMNIGDVAKMAGDYDEAREHFSNAQVLYQGLRPDHPGIVEALTELASVESFAGNLEQARADYQRGLELLQDTRDPTHPDIARLHLSLGELASQAGQYPEARAELATAAELFEQAFGPKHLMLGYALGSLGYVDGWLGDFERGRAELERSLEIIEAAVGREHYYFADAAGKLGALAFLAGDYATAGQNYELARSSLEQQMGADHPSVGIAITNLAELALAEGQPALALERADAALAILEAKLGPDAIDLSLALDTRGLALQQLGRASEAVAALQRALALHEREHHDARELVALRFALAQALVLDRGDLQQARDLAELARAVASEAQLPAIEAWLSANMP